jgi:hypothetical protein
MQALMRKYESKSESNVIFLALAPSDFAQNSSESFENSEA